MKRNLVIAGIILVGIVIFLSSGLGLFFSSDKKFDKFFTVSPNSYKPYDCKFFYDELKRNAGGGFNENKRSFDVSAYNNLESVNNTYMVVSPNFYPTTEAVHQLKNFANKGNNVFIAAFGFTTEFLDSLYYSPKNDDPSIAYPPYLVESRWNITWREDSLLTTKYHLWGHKPGTTVLDSIFLLSNNLVTDIDTLVTDNANNIQMLEVTCGYGRIFLCNNPILVSNYFLLYQDNYTLFNRIADRINLADNNIIWDDYYRTVNSLEDSGNSSGIGRSEVFRVIFQNPPLVWAFYTFIAGIALFLLIYYRRIQKAIPIYSTPKNNSEAYINVVSGLYWQQQNHKSIADKIITQFFEYLAHNFHIHAKDFQESELEKISLKTGRSTQNIREIFDEITYIKSQDEITKQSLMNIYQRINSFYQA
jgi:hypothetical protein